MNFTLDQFAPRVGSVFALQADACTELPAELLAARPLPGHAPQGRQAFSLTFRTPLEMQLPQRIYRLRLDDEVVELFIVPTGADAQGLHYQAVFG